ncbi:caspase family protein [Streptomyces luteogriseus]|uniref:HD domain-containing protein n=1 Tax=Streptomyces luteogriseus TaxID=68233 RepID=UPI003822A325
MARYRAMLIGVARYAAPGISALPFVPGELERMAVALTARGFQVSQLADPTWQLTPNIINGEITSFLTKAEPGDRLLIMLSGHGVHSEGKDYLVPEDIHPELSTFVSGCVEIDWRAELEHCRAAQIVFLIDACREGIERDTKGTSAWTNRKVAGTLRRKVAYIYACSKAEYARYVRETDTVRDGHEVGTRPRESFSLFSRAVTDLLGGTVSTLREFRPAVQERVDALHSAYGKPGTAQQVRVLTEDDLDDFVLFPPGERDAATDGEDGMARAWAETVTGHVAWQRTNPVLGTTVDVLREYCGRLAGNYARACAEAERGLPEDPWYDRELARRTAERLGFLLVHLPEQSRLSPTEAALLTVLPFAAQAHWSRHAAHQGLPGAELSNFLPAFPRLHRRLRALEQQSLDQAAWDIRWWVLHRWLVQHPDAFTTRFLSRDAATTDTAPGWVREELSAERLVRYLREQRIASAAVPGTTRSTALANERSVAPSTAHEHDVRERLVSSLFKAAHALAVDPADLPEVLAEHLGISDSVSLKALHTTVNQSHWLPSGAGRSLNALCEHPAVELALRRHADMVDALLRDINKESTKKGSSLAPLSSLPAYADAQQVHLSTKTPAELSSGIRFRLADDRVQELLMGEQFYGNRALAVRELYQNALDALRYRSARTEYLRRTGVDARDWHGEITFRDGTDERGRSYLECVDNGIGMGVTELSRSFSRGGSRFVDLPEYLEEAALWASLDPPVEFVPVSRFGLGVLSYFMLCDELTVLTCRLDRQGRPGHRLKVTIAGPGNLFRVEDLGPGAEAGTTVRLHAAPGREIPSSGAELVRYLRVSPYRVQAVGRNRKWKWEPGELRLTTEQKEARAAWHSSRRQLVPNEQAEKEREHYLRNGFSNPYLWSRYSTRRGVSDEQLDPPGPVASARQRGVWWVEGEGSLLVDGITGGTNLFGRTVDLHGSKEVTPSVDRKQILHYDRELLHQRCLGAVDDLVDRARFLVPEWLRALRERDARLAEAIVVRAAEKRITWQVHGWTIDLGRTGFFPPDQLLLPAVSGTFPWPSARYDIVAAQLILCMPETIVGWRLRALHPEIPMGSLPVAKPSDVELLLSGEDYRVEWERGLGEVEARFERTLRELHNHGRVWEHFGSEGLRQLVSLPTWRPFTQPVSERDLLLTAVRTGHDVGYVIERLRRIGYDVPSTSPLSTTTFDDMPLVAPNWPDPASPVLVPSEGCVPLGHLYRQPRPDEAARRLAELGYELPEPAPDCLLRPEDMDADDRTLISRLTSYYKFYGTPISPADASSVTQEAIRFCAPLHPRQDHQHQEEAVVRRLTRLGFTLTSRKHPTRVMREPNPRVRSRLTSPSGPELGSAHAYRQWLDECGPLTAVQLRVAATLANSSVEAIRSGLHHLGLRQDLGTDPAGDQLLIRAFEDPGSLPGPTELRGRHVRLAEIASAAIIVRRPFRELAAKATALGLQHEAQDWWDADA